ncbi:BatD family protein [Kaistella palustris]|uniref:BatD family protein n=1 Tax=Kaistella palustris TaxID=493376 RepID=UPI00040E99D7|nr:BatD family protein [Kaistella palustris]
MKKSISYITFLFLSVLSYGQVTLAVSEVKDPKVNQRFNLTVLLEISGENMEQETPLRMPDLSKFEVIGSASEQNTIVVDAKKGDVINQMIYQWVLTPKQAGRVKFGSVLVTVNGKIYKTEPFDINVRENEKKASVAAVDDDVYLNLEVDDRTVYANQPAIAVLRAYSRNYGSFRKVSGIHYPTQKNIRIKPISFAKSEIESTSGIASQVIAAFMIFPSEAGNIEISPVIAKYLNASKENRISSNRIKLNVKKLPAGMPLDFKNAVGKFNATVTHTNATEIPEVEKPVNISLRLNGTGNFGTMQIPTLKQSENYTFFPPQISTKTTAKETGLAGEIIADYVVIPKKPGLISIAFEPFSFFDPNTKKYVDLGEKSVMLNVKTHAEILDGKSPLEKMNDYTNTVLETVNTPVLQTHNLKIKSKDEINWKIVLGNLALLTGVFAMFLLVQKKVRKQRLKPVPAVKTVTTVAQTEELIRDQWDPHFDDHLAYLKKLAENKDFDQFFAAYDELKKDTKRYYKLAGESDFKNWLEEKGGTQYLEKYRSLTEQIQIEKFAPFHTEEHIETILKTIEMLYAEIIK